MLPGSGPPGCLLHDGVDSLSADLARNGRGLDAAMHERFARLAQYAVALNAGDAPAPRGLIWPSEGASAPFG